MEPWRTPPKPSVEVATIEYRGRLAVELGIVVEGDDPITLAVSLSPTQALLVAEAIYRHAYKIGGALN